MHSKTKGGLGVSKTVSYFIRNNIPVFVEAYCDLSDVDLVFQWKGQLRSAQVRSVTSRNGVAELSVRSITPGTRNSPCKISRLSMDIDLYVLYVLDKDVLLFVPGQELQALSCSASFSFASVKNDKRIRKAEMYMSLGDTGFDSRAVNLSE